MNDTTQLIGALSNDLFRVAAYVGRGSNVAAVRFFSESKRWSGQIENHDVPLYIQKIIQKVNTTSVDTISHKFAEECLMYAVLLQNYALQEIKETSS